jgi:hypothetical protein
MRIHRLVALLALCALDCGGEAASETATRSDGGHEASSGNRGATARSCGVVGLPALITPPCTNGTCPTLLWSGPTDPSATGLTVKGASVYWGNVCWDPAAQQYDATVMAAHIDGGSASTLASVGELERPIEAPLVDSTSLYWSILQGGGIAKLPLGGGTPATLLAGTVISGLAIDNGNLYGVTTDDSDGAYENDLLRNPISGGSTVTLSRVPSTRGHPGAPPTSAYGGGITLNAGTIYWEGMTAYPDDGAVGCHGGCIGAAYTMRALSTPLAGGAATTIASTGHSDTANTFMAVDASNLYFVDGQALVSVPLAGGAETTVASSPPVGGIVAFDGENFYWPASSGPGDSAGIVAKVAKSGGAVSRVFSLEGSEVLGCTVDTTSVYVLYSVTGTATRRALNTMGGLVKITPK